jgi:hypothetical protein
LSDSRSEKVFHILLPGNIGLNGQEIIPAVQLGSGSTKPIRLPAADDNLGLLLKKKSCDFQADSPAAPRYDNDLILKTVSDHFLSSKKSMDFYVFDFHLFSFISRLIIRKSSEGEGPVEYRLLPEQN